MYLSLVFLVLEPIHSSSSSGLGKELALAILERGHKVIATSRARSLLKLAELKERGATILELNVVAPLSQLREVANKAVGIYGKIDVIVNNAGNVAFGAMEGNTYVSSLMATHMGESDLLRL